MDMKKPIFKERTGNTIFGILGPREHGGKPIIDVCNKKDESLGILIYDDRKRWQQYVWCQDEEMQMSQDCLQHIVDKLKELNKEG